MALVLCFADAVETLQGPTDQPDAATARTRGVFSYGNRLWCDWTDASDPEVEPPQARFRWGSVATYTAYFEDYRRFLARPAEAARLANGRRRSDRAIYVIELDLKEFFDRIDRAHLRTRLGAIWRLYARRAGHRDGGRLDPALLEAMYRIMNWHWSPTSQAQAELFDAGLPDGLPQGLAASGFLSNAYLLRFDRWMGRRLGGNSALVIHDYCRYVDDIRLVVEVDATTDPAEVAERVSKQITALLARYCAMLDEAHKLTINAEKTKVIPWADYALQGSASAQMVWLQGLISATPDQESLRHATAGLDGLLWLSEVIEGAGKPPANPLHLSRIALPKLDVRDDTLKRFAAYRLLKSFRLRQSMATDGPDLNADEVPLQDGASRQVLEHEMEATARKLIASWSRNPALVPVLRCGLELFPSPLLVTPVLDALAVKRSMGDDAEPRQRAVADYVVAELLRAAAVDIGYRNTELIPRAADVGGFRQQLARLARQVLGEGQAVPWHLRQQAALFLASVLQPDADLKADALLANYKLLHDALLFRTPSAENAPQALFTGLVGQQLGADSARFAIWADDILDAQPHHPKRAALVTAVAQMRPDLFRSIWDAHADKRRGWTGKLPRYLKPASYRAGIWKDWSALGPEAIPLVRVVLRWDNPFRQENAILGLAAALLEAMIRAEPDADRGSWGLLDLMVTCNRWSDPQHPDACFSIAVEAADRPDPRNQPPGWCLPDMRWAYALGRILRACIVGDPDFTARGHLLREDAAHYCGLLSSWYKRRLGLLNTPEGLLGEPAPLSPWITELIMTLLQWPGLRLGNGVTETLAGAHNPRQILRVVDARRRRQRDLYAVQSQLPVYVVPASRGVRAQEQSLRVATVQTLLPRTGDFDVKNPLLWSRDFRARHRAHLAAVCRLVAQDFQTERAASDDGGGVKSGHALDLIVFPELSVHPDDLGLLRSLSDVLKANLFVGLTFQETGDGRLVNRALWLLHQERDGQREIVRVHQAKRHMTKLERDMGIVGLGEHQVLIELAGPDGERYRLAGAICYDATDLSLAADLRNKSDCLVIAALNQDVPTFDTMVQALHYHMFQPVVLANSGQFGGSTVQAPYRERYDKVIAHVHGSGQVAVSVFEVDLGAFKSKQCASKAKGLKTWPAGYAGRGW
ncbi:hypothetical protein [Halochromatium salexigens]|uniref:Reverse transcriptase domain-containing protein n=1 Tax=Halochromatium salexigens TaxID=49447 RepID=A0AAJ0UI63_HALSE|nr:hypothetical protein [Halochromatium salexigens]MBK5931960.1 hypothetical protein [Halochromatium salexigens]